MPIRHGVDTDIERVEEYIEDNCDTGLYGIESIDRNTPGWKGKIGNFLSGGSSQRPGDPSIKLTLKDPIELDTVVESLDTEIFTAYPAGLSDEQVDEYGGTPYTELTEEQKENHGSVQIHGTSAGWGYSDGQETVFLDSYFHMDGDHPTLDVLLDYLDTKYSL